MPSMGRNPLYSLLCLCAILGCPAPTPVTLRTVAPVVTSPVASPAPPGRSPIDIDTSMPEGSLTVRIASPAIEHATASSITILPAAQTDALLARLEPLPVLDTTHAAVMRAPSAPPAPVGTIQPIAFVAPMGSTVAERPFTPAPIVPPSLASPEILPNGELGRAESEIHVRFNEPMIPVAAVGDAKTPIATFTPTLEGRWRWIDTRVASFVVSKPRFPGATEYTITVPAGIRAVSGATLALPVSTRFATPPVAIVGRFPEDEIRPDAPIALELDQDIDPDALAKVLRVETDHGKSLPFKLIAKAEADQLWSHHPHLELGDPWPAHDVIVAPMTAWPAGTVMHVVLGKGAPSREGPRVTEQAAAIDVTVVPAFRLASLDCDGKPKLTNVVCPAGNTLHIGFSNAIDKTSFRASKIQLDGVEEAEDHRTYGSLVDLEVPDRVGRTYGITIGDGLTDVYGQPLTGAQHVSFTTTRVRVDPTLDAARGLYVLDPRFEIPQWMVVTQGVPSLHVELYAVQPADYFAFQAFEAGTRKTPPGKRVFDQTFTVGARFMGTARIDLRPALGAAGTGHVIAIATVATSSALVRADASAAAWIEVTKLGVVARLDGDKVSSWIETLASDHFLNPLPGVTASMLVDGRADMPAPVTTDATGHATFELPAYVPATKPVDRARTALLVATSGSDSAFAPIDRQQKAMRVRNAFWYVTDTDFTYKPGATVKLKGWVRWTHNGVNPGLELPAASDVVAYTLFDGRDTKLASGSAHLTDQGGFDLEAAIPANASLGDARFELAIGTETYTHPISIEEFLASHAGVCGHARRRRHARWHDPARARRDDRDDHHGEVLRWRWPRGGARSMDRHADIHEVQTTGVGDPFSFTRVRRRSEYSDHRRGSTAANLRAELSGSSSSSVVFGIVGLPGGNGGPSVLDVDASVTDVDRSTIRASSRSILVHPSAYYVGLREKPTSLDELEVVVTDIDGNAVPNVPIDVSIEGVLRSEADRDDAKVVDTQRCALKSATTPVICAWKPGAKQNAYRAVARVADARGRTNAAQVDIPRWDASDDRASLSIVPDRASYRPGQIAKLTIHSAVTPATAVVSFARQGLIAQQRVELAAEATVVELPIELAYIQNVHVSVDRWNHLERGNHTRRPFPDHTSAQLELPVDLDSARLVMTAHPTKPVVQPGDDATFEVEVAHDGKPVAGAEVALMVVDEAVLALSTRSYYDPLGDFYRDVEDGTTPASTFDLVRDADFELDGVPGYQRLDLDAPSTTRTGIGHGGMRGRTTAVPTVSIGSAPGPTKARTDFRATAVFSPRLHTDASGKVRLTVKMPDSLTRFRVVAFATSNTYFFGKAEGTIATQRKINARAVAPRFLYRRAEDTVLAARGRAKPRHRRANRRRCRACCEPRDHRASRQARDARAGHARRSAVRGRDGDARACGDPDDRELGPERGCLDERSSGLRAGHDRDVRDLRRRRRQARVRANRGTRRRVSRGRRYRDGDRVDPAPVADRRVLVPLHVSVRVRGAALEPDARDVGDVRSARRVRDAGPAHAQGARRPAQDRSRSARLRAALRRWLGLLDRHEE